MIRSLFGKLFTFTTFIICIGIAVLVLLFSLVSAQAWNNERLNILEGNAKAICNAYKSLTVNDETENLDIIIDSLATSYNSSVFFVDNEGRTYVCSEINKHENCVHLQNKVDNKTLSLIKSKELFRETGTLSGLYVNAHHTVGMPLKDYSGAINGAVFISLAVESVSNYTTQIITASVLVAVFILLALTIFIYIFSKGMLSPIHQMTEATKAMAKGDLTRRVKSRLNKDEIQELSDSFNAMAESFESLEKMSSSFVSNVSHELKTPMTSIGGFIDGILNGTIPPEKSKYYLNIVSDEIKRLTSVVNSMLALAKLESGRTSLVCTKTDLVDIVCKVVILFEKKIIDKEIQIIGLEDVDRIFVECDSELMYQVVYNLFDNAVKYTHNGGYISIFINKYSSHIEFYIKNSGDGIEDEDLKYIFDRFYKIDKSRSVDKSGFGLGLHIVKNIISYHNGDIQAKSIPGQYTQFCVTLPINHDNGEFNEY